MIQSGLLPQDSSSFRVSKVFQTTEYSVCVQTQTNERMIMCSTWYSQYIYDTVKYDTHVLVLAPALQLIQKHEWSTGNITNTPTTGYQ